jgi:hypothetical protein
MIGRVLALESTCESRLMAKRPSRGGQSVTALSRSSDVDLPADDKGVTTRAADMAM